MMAYSTLRQQDLSWSTMSAKFTQRIRSTNSFSDLSDVDDQSTVNANEDAQSRVSEVDEPDRKEEVAKFFAEFQAKNFKDVPVTTMRHIIPPLLMEVFAELYGSYTRKVKGIWKQKPKPWPENIPFVDPNNKLRGNGSGNGCKPKKELLTPMLNYLVTKYMEKMNLNGGETMAEEIVPLQAVEEETPFYYEPADWDPKQDMLERLGRKIAFIMEIKDLIGVGELKIFRDAFDVLRRSDNEADDWLVYAHKLDLALDQIRKAAGNGIRASITDLLIELQIFSARYANEQTGICFASGPVNMPVMPHAGSVLMSELNIAQRGGGNAELFEVVDLNQGTGQQRVAFGDITSSKSGGTDYTKSYSTENLSVEDSRQHGAVAVDDVRSQLNIKARDGCYQDELLKAMELRESHENSQLGQQLDDDDLKAMKDDFDLQEVLDLVDAQTQRGPLPVLDSNMVYSTLGGENFESLLCEIDSVAAAGGEPEPPPDLEMPTFMGFEQPVSSDGGMMVAAGLEMPSSRISTPSFDSQMYIDVTASPVYDSSSALLSPLSASFKNIAGTMEGLTLQTNGNTSNVMQATSNWQQQFSTMYFTGNQMQQLQQSQFNYQSPSVATPVARCNKRAVVIPSVVEDMDNNSDDDDDEMLYSEPSKKACHQLPTYSFNGLIQ